MGFSVYHDNARIVSMGKKKEKKGQILRSELERYQQQGVSLWLNGRESTPKEIVKAHKIAEDSVYMRDYIHNQKGEVERLEFDLIKLKQQ
ncbi:MAG: hypothetical protein ACOYBL_09990 [Lachnospiraceae bacterium]|jgi:hypothetical protein